MKNLKLNILEQNQLSSNELNNLQGGNNAGNCTCGCKYAGEPGGASKADNMAANHDRPGNHVTDFE